jgi:hypothetical protein
VIQAGVIWLVEPEWQVALRKAFCAEPDPTELVIEYFAIVGQTQLLPAPDHSQRPRFGEKRRIGGACCWVPRQQTLELVKTIGYLLSDNEQNIAIPWC